MVYSSGNLSLAALEILVHADPADLPEDMLAIAADIPENQIKTLKMSDLPANWRNTDPGPRSLVARGKRWLDEETSLVLAVPSSIIPNEYNYLINPDHPEFYRVLPRTPEAFEFDPRLGTV